MFSEEQNGNGVLNRKQRYFKTCEQLISFALSVNKQKRYCNDIFKKKYTYINYF